MIIIIFHSRHMHFYLFNPSYVISTLYLLKKPARHLYLTSVVISYRNGKIVCNLSKMKGLQLKIQKRLSTFCKISAHSRNLGYFEQPFETAYFQFGPAGAFKWSPPHFLRQGTIGKGCQIRPIAKSKQHVISMTKASNTKVHNNGIQARSSLSESRIQ